jgi:hypothetical protein
MTVKTVSLTSPVTEISLQQPAGVYVLNFYSKGNMFTEKIIVE